MPNAEEFMPKVGELMPKLLDPISKLKGLASKRKGFRCVFVTGTAFLFTVVAGSERSEASYPFAFTESASVQSAFPAYGSLTPDRADVALPRSPREAQQSTKAIVTVQSLPAPEPQVPTETGLKPPATPLAAAPLPNVGAVAPLPDARRVAPVPDVRSVEAP